MSEEVPEVPLVYVSNPYLEKKAAAIRQKPILWEVKKRKRKTVQRKKKAETNEINTT